MWFFLNLYLQQVLDVAIPVWTLTTAEVRPEQAGGGFIAS